MRGHASAVRDISQPRVILSFTIPVVSLFPRAVQLEILIVSATCKKYNKNGMRRWARGMGTGKELPLIRTSFLFAFDAPQMSAMSRRHKPPSGLVDSKSLSNSKIADVAACDWRRLCAKYDAGCAHRSTPPFAVLVKSQKLGGGGRQANTIPLTPRRTLYLPSPFLSGQL